MSLSLNGRTVPGADTLQSAIYTGPASYVTGGELLTPAMFGFSVLRRVIECRAASVASAVNVPVPVVVLSTDGQSITSLNLAFVVGTTGVQVANAANLSALTYSLIVEGD